MSAGPLVSVAIPAYNERFFPAALASALAQTYPVLEIVVCDDSPGDAIERAASEVRDPRLRYFRNPRRLGFEGNFSECLGRSRGEFMKFLNDDDRLRPHCVSGLVAGFQLDPRITLATSRRAVIDEEGKSLPHIAATVAVAHVASVMGGRELGDFVLVNSLNFIGEPTTAMFRRSDLEPEAAGIFTWGGRSFHCLADLALWLRLLARGWAFYQPTPLSELRLHPGQQQRLPGMDIACLEERLHLLRQARSAGFLANRSHVVAALARIREFASTWHGQPLEASQRTRLDALLSELETLSVP